jgi:hypothetical protein
VVEGGTELVAVVVENERKDGVLRRVGEVKVFIGIVPVIAAVLLYSVGTIICSLAYY